MRARTIIIMALAILVAGVIKHNREKVDIMSMSDEEIEMMDFDYGKLTSEEYARVMRVKNTH